MQHFVNLFGKHSRTKRYLYRYHIAEYYSFLSFGLNGSTQPMISPWLSYVYSNEKISVNLYFWGYYSFFRHKSNGYSIIFNDKMDTSSYRSYTEDAKNNSVSAGAYMDFSYNIDSMKTLTFYVGGGE